MRTGEAGGHVSIIKAVNLALRFLLELCALAALGSWGWHVGTGRATKLGFAVGAPLIAAIVWGLFVAPGRPVDPSVPVRVVLELAVFGAAAAGLTAAGRFPLAAALLLVYAVNRILMVAWEQ